MRRIFAVEPNRDANGNEVRLYGKPRYDLTNLNDRGRELFQCPDGHYNDSQLGERCLAMSNGAPCQRIMGDEGRGEQCGCAACHQWFPTLEAFQKHLGTVVFNA